MVTTLLEGAATSSLFLHHHVRQHSVAVCCHTYLLCLGDSLVPASIVHAVALVYSPAIKYKEVTRRAS